MESLEKFYNWQTTSVILVLSYFVLVGSTYLVVYKFGETKFKSYKIQRPSIPAFKIRLEIFYSMLTLIIYTISSWLVYQLYQMGATKIYFDFQQHSIVYFLTSILIMILLHDTYFYWTHRLIHHPLIFKIVHRVHHLSKNPSPWASYSFHPFEAIISVGYIFIIILLFPAHPLALLTALGVMFIFNLLGHLGYEFFPKWFVNSKLGRWINCSTFHNLHHEESRHNFGLYFTFWDRIMGTFKGS